MSVKEELIAELPDSLRLLLSLIDKDGSTVAGLSAKSGYSEARIRYSMTSLIAYGLVTARVNISQGRRQRIYHPSEADTSKRIELGLLRIKLVKSISSKKKELDLVEDQMAELDEEVQDD